MTESATFPSRVADALRRTLPSRLRAAGIHLVLCVAIYLVALYLMLVYWYPGFHFSVDGGWHGARIMAAVDLVLGPMLTLIIFNPLKARKLIVFDLSCIGLTQLGALVWGFYAIHSQRPVAVTYYEGSFQSITVEPLNIEKYDVAQLAELSERRPPLAYVAEPANDEEEARAAMQEVMGTVAPHEDPFFFQKFADHWPQIRPHAVEASARAKGDKDFAAELPKFLESRHAQAADYLYFPYVGRDASCTVAFTPAGELSGVLGCVSL